jgi:ribosomal protein L37E
MLLQLAMQDIGQLTDIERCRAEGPAAYMRRVTMGADSGYPARHRSARWFREVAVIDTAFAVGVILWVTVTSILMVRGNA